MLVQPGFADEMGGDRGGQEKEDRDQDFVNREAAVPEEKEKHGSDQGAANPDGRGFGWRVQAGHQIGQLDQAK